MSNLNKLYYLSHEVHRLSQNGRTIMDYYHDFKIVCEDLNSTMPITNDVTEMRALLEKLLVFGWILGLEEYDMI